MVSQLVSKPFYALTEVESVLYLSDKNKFNILRNA